MDGFGCMEDVWYGGIGVRKVSDMRVLDVFEDVECVWYGSLDVFLRSWIGCDGCLVGI